jgi:hypothetical protein
MSGTRCHKVFAFDGAGFFSQGSSIARNTDLRGNGTGIAEPIGHWASILIGEWFRPVFVLVLFLVWRGGVCLGGYAAVHTAVTGSSLRDQDRGTHAFCPVSQNRILYS